MNTLYNEWDAQAAAWIEALIDRRVLHEGPVDTRDIEDVLPSDLIPYDRVHMFAGIGTWDYALTLAGWPDDREVWTVSAPCQPFSAAGKRAGTADKRHLWPAVDWLVGQRRPHTILGEQVASKDGRAWFDHVQADLENRGYAIGAAVTPAAGYGAPHERHRLYFVATLADSIGSGLEGRDVGALGYECSTAERGGGVGGLALDSSGGCRVIGGAAQPAGVRHVDGGGVALGGLADDVCVGRVRRGSGVASDGRTSAWIELERLRDVGKPTYMPGPTNGFWRDADWLGCRDDRWRPVESGTFPLVNGASARVGRLRGYGNGIVLPQAVAFIQSFLEGEAEFLGLRGL